MKKSLVILLLTVAMMISGCQKKEEKLEIVVPSTTEVSTEEKDEIPNDKNEDEKIEIKDEEKEETNKLLSIDDKNLQIKLISDTKIEDIIKKLNVKEKLVLIISRPTISKKAI